MIAEIRTLMQPTPVKCPCHRCETGRFQKGFTVASFGAFERDNQGHGSLWLQPARMIPPWRLLVDIKKDSR